MRITITTLFLILLSAGLAAAQERAAYPLPVTGPGLFEVPAGQEFWVLTDSQYKQALNTAMTAEIDSLRLAKLTEKLQVYELMVAHKDSVTGEITNGYVHYRDLWEETDRKLEEEEVKSSQRFMFFQVGFWVGAVTAGVIAIAAN